MSERLLDVQGLDKSYRSATRKIDVLRGLDLEVESGEIVAIVGESGVGKSTLLHVLGGLDRPDAGRFLFEGRDMTRAAAPELAQYRNRSVGFIFQFHHLLPEFTALENVEMPFRIAGAEFDFTARSREILERIGLSERLDHTPGTLSGGEQQRVAIARAVVAGPSLVLADEPTGNLDPATGQRVFDTLTALQGERSFAMVLATHNERLAGRCDRVLRMVEGRLYPLGDAEARAYFNGLEQVPAAVPDGTRR